MKAQILKIAGVKSEKEFYKKYPSEEAFMKVHGKAFKKAQVGAMINKTETLSNPKMINFQTMYDQADMDVTGMTDEMRQKQAAAQAEQAAKSSDGGGGGGMDIGGMMKMFGGEGGGGAEGMAAAFGRYGVDIPRAQNGKRYFPTAQEMQQERLDAESLIDNSQDYNADSYNQRNTVSLTDDEVANKNGKYNGYSDPGGPTTKENTWSNIGNALGKNAGPVGDIISGIGELKKEKEARKAAEQQKAVSDITLKASQTRPEQIQRKYVRPEDIQNTGEEFFPIYGVGTNVLARNGIRLQDGGGIGGNPTEIQNTYSDGYDIYSDGGYEPLYNPNQIKDFRHGGDIHRAQNGFQNWQNSMSGGGKRFSGAGSNGSTPWGAIGSTATGAGQAAMGGQNAGGKIGGSIGKGVGSIFGPAGGAIGEFVGGMAGNALDTNAKRMKKAQSATQRNIQTMALNSGFQGLQAQNSSYVRNGGDIPSYEDGGYMNPEYNPQVITMFGDHNAQDFADYAHKFRAGGHLQSYTPPSERAMETYRNGGGIKSYGLGGELETHWGGGAETMSHNPYLPGTGETVMFRGKSHEEYSPNGETGIGVTYGGNPVEVERGEPMVELEEGGEIDPETGEPSKSGVVFGNLKIPNQ